MPSRPGYVQRLDMFLNSLLNPACPEHKEKEGIVL